MLLLPYLKLIRTRQWVKNLFVFVPFLFSPFLHDSFSLIYLLKGFFAFCAISSSIYILNDYLDRAADRLHPRKKDRPLASGKVSGKMAMIMMTGLVLMGTLLALSLPKAFGFGLLAYACLNIIYCFYSKNFAIIDVMSIALGFVLRVYAGAGLILVTPSVWILLCTGFIALFLAFAKRRDDIIGDMSKKHRASLAGYNQTFLDTACVMCLTSVLIFYALYTNDATVQKTLGTTDLYLTLPSVVLGMFRYMQITFVEQQSGDPTHIVTSDKMIIGACVSWLLIVIYLVF